MSLKPAQYHRIKAFSLVEVIFALAIAAFALVGLVGLLGTGLHTGKDSEEQIRAANVASLLASGAAAWGKTTEPGGTGVPAFGIPRTPTLINSYTNAFTSPTYIGYDGGITTNIGAAAYQITCNAGTNAVTGSQVSQVYVVLTWPPSAATNTAPGRYELLTYVPIR